MGPLSQPAKKIANVSSQFDRPVRRARIEGKNALEEGTILLTDNLLQTLKRIMAGAAVVESAVVRNIRRTGYKANPRDQST